MNQLSFADLEGLPPFVGRYFTTKPLPGTRAYKDEQEIRQWQQWQSHVSQMLVRDGWVLDRVWDDGQWRWGMRHLHTSLATLPLSALHDAIDQALWLATFYELLPFPELRKIAALHPEWLRALPSFFHRYQYEPATAKRWQDEYFSRLSTQSQSTQ